MLSVRTIPPSGAHLIHKNKWSVNLDATWLQHAMRRPSGSPSWMRTALLLLILTQSTVGFYQTQSGYDKDHGVSPICWASHVDDTIDRKGFDPAYATDEVSQGSTPLMVIFPSGEYFGRLRSISLLPPRFNMIQLQC